MSSRVLGLLGLAARAGAITIGTSATRAGLQRGAVRVVLVAGDRSLRTEEKVERLARGTGVPVVVGPDAVTLGARIGRGAVQAVGIVGPGFAEGILAAGSSG
ncbi:MAG: ribosomal L7Ae/L30e/S12e/Gadd45 family protein [Gemmatimonadota bacterium]|nr:ribosomal L7Ae/L30e/S12e/Gadd45 family protein [Thermoleophilia bacterium]MDH5195893.1 ribosomal L7Ae/L30e/S12e/Gadd45 family protein [Gemmatimonadota bacterium]